MKASGVTSGGAIRAMARRSQIENRAFDDIAGLEGPQAAVHRLRVVEGTAAAEVAALDKGRRQAALGGVVRDGEAVDAPADDEHVESPRGEAGQVADHDAAVPAGALPEGREYSIVSGHARQARAAGDRRGPGVLEPSHPRPGDLAAPAGLAGFLRGPRRVPLRQAAPPARARRLQRVRRPPRARCRAAAPASTWCASPGEAQSRLASTSRTRPSPSPERTCGHQALLGVAVCRRRRTAAVPGRHVRLRLRPRRRAVHRAATGRSSRSAGGCSRPAARRSSRSTTASPGSTRSPA